MVSSQEEDSPDSTPSARAMRSKQTGQSSIGPENSLPQIEQTRWSSVLMVLTAVQPQPEPKATPRFTEWCEIGRQAQRLTFCLSHFTSNRLLRDTSALNHVDLHPAMYSSRKWSRLW